MSLTKADWENGGFGLYIHWPFCEAKCPYCDFNSHVATKIDHKSWRGAYLREIDRIASETPHRTLHSIFFGGGTPSLMHPETVAAILERVRTHWRFANDLEVTLEANPSSVETAKFKDFRAAGVSRVSVGVQALNNDDLRRLGRLHSVEEARKALEIANENFDQVSFDLIYARQDQSLNDWRLELGEALRFGATHLSLYQLTIEPGTAFGARHEKEKLKGLPDEDLSADLYDLTQDMCGSAGLPAYEISNHAADGQHSRHNFIYWRGGDYAGIGPGAHGRISYKNHRFTTETHLHPQIWLKAVSENGTGESHRSALTAKEHAEEYLMMSLRLAEGSDLNRFADIRGEALNEAAIESLTRLGLIFRARSNIIATSTGRPILNEILRQLLI